MNAHSGTGNLARTVFGRTLALERPELAPG